MDERQRDEMERIRPENVELVDMLRRMIPVSRNNQDSIQIANLVDGVLRIKKK